MLYPLLPLYSARHGSGWLSKIVVPPERIGCQRKIPPRNRRAILTEFFFNPDRGIDDSGVK